MNDTRKESRMQVSLVTRYREPSMVEPREGECRDISPSGMFIMTPRPSPRGALIRFECSTDVTDGDFRGTGRVVWQRNKSDPRGPAGMGVRFVRLEPGGREAVALLVDLARIDRGRNQSDLDRRTSSRPPPRPRSTKTISQPFAAAAASPDPKPAESSSKPARHSPTLRGVTIHPPPVAVSATAGRTSSVPPAPKRRTIISSGPPPASGQESKASTSSSASSSRPPGRAARAAGAPSGSNPPSGTRTSSRPPPVRSPLPAAPTSDRPGVERASPVARAASVAVGATDDGGPVAEAKSQSDRPLAPASGNAGARDHAEAPDRDGAPRSNSDRPLRGDRAWDSDRPPGPGVTDDLRGQGHGSGAPARDAPGAGPTPRDPAQPALFEKAEARGAGRQPLWLTDGEGRSTGSRFVPWIITGTGLLVSMLLIKLYGSSPVGVPIEVAGDQPKTASPPPATEPPTVPTSEPVRPAVTTTPSPAPPSTARSVVPSSVTSAAAVKPTVPAKPATPPTVVAAAPPPASAVAAKPEAAASKSKPKSAAAPTPAKVPAPASARETPAASAAATTLSATAPKAVAASESPSTPDPQQTPLQQALQCLGQGDNDCVLRALEGKASSERELELLIATYRAMGAVPKAEREMQRYLDSFPAGTRAQTYKRLLERRNAEPAGEPHASPEAPAQPPP